MRAHRYIARFDALFNQLKPGAVVLTPNKRLSRFVQAQFTHHQGSKNLRAWARLDCLSVNAWLQSLWENFSFSSRQPAPLLISASQETAIWLDVIRQNSDAVDLFNPAATAMSCRRAWNTLVQWDLASADLAGLSPLLAAWIKGYQNVCAERELIDGPCMVNRLLAAIEQDQVALPASLVVFAFDDVNPQVERLLELAKHKGVEVEKFSLEIAHAKLSRVELSNFDDEIRTAARWAAALCARDPGASIGIVIPKLLPLREKVERIVTEVFEPQYVFPESARHAPGFNISAGLALSATPPVAAALLALTLNSRELDIEDVSKILLSPFIGNVQELPARALLEDDIRQWSIAVRIADLRTKVGAFGQSANERGPEKNDVAPLNDLYRRLHEFHQLYISAPPRQSPSAWGEFFCRQLDALGWPGSRALDTLEYQQIEAWRQSLAQLSAFDHVYPEIKCARALELLRRIAVDTQFQAQTGTSPVQVLGLFEAAGMVFDYLWVMNLDNASWPPPVDPNPLLPLNVQKRERMPMASVERELTLARRLTERFKTSAPTVVFSHAVGDADQALQVSSLVADVAEISPTDLAQIAPVDYLAALHHVGGLESCTDVCGPAVADPKTARGGTQILKDQAACPFRAFARHRLRAVETDRAAPGISAAERGILIHDALEYLWKKLRDQATLHALADEQLTRLIADSAQRALQRIAARKDLGARLQALECDRLCRLLQAWLALEKQRAPFEVIFRETKNAVTLAQLPIRIRYDRIDKLHDGSLFIVDYKTAKSEVRAWAGSRPDEPQVPLYAIANAHAVSGVAFAQLNAAELAFKGIGELADAVPGLASPDSLNKLDLPDSWPQIIEHWRAVLEQLAREFLAGAAAVAPKHKINSCRYCRLHSLCRIKEATTTAPDDEGAQTRIDAGAQR